MVRGVPALRRSRSFFRGVIARPIFLQIVPEMPIGVQQRLDNRFARLAKSCAIVEDADAGIPWSVTPPIVSGLFSSMKIQRRFVWKFPRHAKADRDDGAEQFPVFDNAP